MPSSNEVAVAYILKQNEDVGRGHLVYYTRRLLASYELRYSAIEKLATTLLFAGTKFKHYLLSSSILVEVQCTHEGLKYLIQQANPSSRAARFTGALQEFYLVVKGVKRQRASQSKILLELGKPQPSNEGALSENIECLMLNEDNNDAPSYYKHI
jgi:hypothetical protein